MKLDRWIPISEAAALAEVSVRTMRRRMHALNSRCGGQVMRSYEPEGAKPRKYFVSAEALLHFMRTDPSALDNELAEIHARMDDFDRKLLALRDSHRALKRRVKSAQAVPTSATVGQDLSHSYGSRRQRPAPRCPGAPAKIDCACESFAAVADIEGPGIKPSP